MVGLFVVSGCDNHYVPDHALTPMNPRLTGDWALTILRVAWLLGSTTSYGYCLAFFRFGGFDQHPDAAR